MGTTSYSVEDRSVRSGSLGFASKSVNEIFTQNKVKRIHQDMSPKDVLFRESRDSETHPETVPIQFYLDLTGSMGHIPHEMIKEGLPTLMGTLIQNGVPDASLMFGGIGDHEADFYPLQIGQFESGDAELDMWLTRTYIEGGGGGNTGESYLLAWYFAANHIQTDAYSKRGQKGFLFTIGDEPCLRSLPLSAIKGIMGSTAAGQESLSMESLLEQAQKTNHVFHIHVEHGHRTCPPMWKELLGPNLINLEDYTKVSKVISDIVTNPKYYKNAVTAVQTEAPKKPQAPAVEMVENLL